MRFYKGQNLVILFFIFFQTGCFGKNDQDAPVIKQKLLQQDFQILRKTLEEVHPGLYWYSSKKEMDRFFDSSYSLIKKDMSGIDYFKFLLPVIAHLRCSHTGIQLSNERELMQTEFKKLLPFEFYCRPEGVFIKRDFKNPGHAGMKVTSINGQSSEEILEKLFSLIPSDGYNMTFKYQVLSGESFIRGYASFFGQPDSFAITGIAGTNSKPVSFSVKSISPSEYPRSERDPSAWVETRFFESDSIVMLSLNTFEINSTRFRDSMQMIFESIQKRGVKSLIIDLRRNGGGNNRNVSTLFSFIASTPFLHLKKTEMNKPGYTYRRNFLNPDVNSDFRGIPDSAGKYSVNHNYPGTSTVHAVSSHHFNGKVVVLISGLTVSAASEFAAIAKHSKRAALIGEETGGCYYGSTGGTYIHLQLPNSRLVVRIPAVRIFNAVNEDFHNQPKGRGVFPDLPVEVEIADLEEGRDLVLEKAMEWLKEAYLNNHHK